jgi:hypothetical protein
MLEQPKIQRRVRFVLCYREQGIAADACGLGVESRMGSRCDVSVPVLQLSVNT